MRIPGAGRAGRCPGCAGRRARGLPGRALGASRLPAPHGGGTRGLLPVKPKPGSAFVLVPWGAAARPRLPPLFRAGPERALSALPGGGGLLRRPGPGPGSPAYPRASPWARGAPPPPHGGRPAPPRPGRRPHFGAEPGAVGLVGASPAGAGWGEGGIRTSGLPAPAPPGSQRGGRCWSRGRGCGWGWPWLLPVFSLAVRSGSNLPVAPGAFRQVAVPALSGAVGAPTPQPLPRARKSLHN